MFIIHNCTTDPSYTTEPVYFETLKLLNRFEWQDPIIQLVPDVLPFLCEILQNQAVPSARNTELKLSIAQQLVPGTTTESLDGFAAHIFEIFTGALTAFSDDDDEKLSARGHSYGVHETFAGLVCVFEEPVVSLACKCLAKLFRDWRPSYWPALLRCPHFIEAFVIMTQKPEFQSIARDVVGLLVHFQVTDADGNVTFPHYDHLVKVGYEPELVLAEKAKGP